MDLTLGVDTAGVVPAGADLSDLASLWNRGRVIIVAAAVRCSGAAGVLAVHSSVFVVV
tara:strand:- start:338 stop:511 length:174 start_codon:yes stop_codon:yes gene_type:complete